MASPPRMTAGGLERLKQNLQREHVRLDEARDYVRDQMESNEAESLNLVEAQQQLALVEERVAELQDLLASAQVIEQAHGAHDVVSLGDVVLLTDLASGRTRRVQLVSPAEAAASSAGAAQISSDSPVGTQLEGRRAGERFTVSVNRREVHYQVTQIEDSTG